MVPMHKVKEQLPVLAARFSSSLVLPSLHIDYLSDQRSIFTWGVALRQVAKAQTGI